MKLESLKTEIETLWQQIAASTSPAETRKKYTEAYAQYARLKAWHEALKS